MKYFILRALDVAGLKVLEPIVRLICGEEPMLQLKKIGLFICVPILTFLVFLGTWSYVGPRHKTKSGEVPGPGRVLEAWNGITQFAYREFRKGADKRADGYTREKAIGRVHEDTSQIEKYSKLSNERFVLLEKKKDQELKKGLAVYLAALQTKEAEYASNAKDRESKLLTKAEEIDADDVSAKTEFATLVHQHLEIGENGKEHLRAMRAEIDELRQRGHGVDANVLGALKYERKRKNAIDQQKQFLVKRQRLLTSENRSVIVGKLNETMNQDKRAFIAATTGPEMLSLATKLIKTDKRISDVENSEYVGASTLFEQTWMSVKCVLVGFLIASAIAIPIGVLCGLNDVFMAAMSPLISLFKPVSPIVWLPIVFIIVGGFNIPEVEGRFKWLFEPAFLASAITVALCSLWPTLVNTALGVASIDKDHVNVARVLRLGFWSRLFKIVIPSALPLIFTGLRISLGVGWMVLIAAELLSSSNGLGKYVWDMFNNGSSETFAQMFVVVFVVGLIGLLLDRIMIIFQRLVSFDGAATAL